jgi:hypothetical protein
MQRQPERSLAEILQEVIRTMRWSDRVNDARIVSLWSKVAGKTISNYTRKLYVRKRVLYVEIDSSPLRLELYYIKEKVRLALNMALGEEYIMDIVVR